MNPRIRHKLADMQDRLQEVGLLLAQPETMGDGARFRELSREYAQLERLSQDYANRKSVV